MNNNHKQSVDINSNLDQDLDTQIKIIEHQPIESSNEQNLNSSNNQNESIQKPQKISSYQNSKFNKQNHKQNKILDQQQEQLKCELNNSKKDESQQNQNNNKSVDISLTNKKKSSEHLQINHDEKNQKKNSDDIIYDSNHFDILMKQESNAQEDELNDKVNSMQQNVHNTQNEHIKNSISQYLSELTNDENNNAQVPPLNTFLKTEEGQKQLMNFIIEQQKLVSKKLSEPKQPQSLIKIEICVLLPSSSQRDANNIHLFLYKKLKQNELKYLFLGQVTQEKNPPDDYLEYVPQNQLAQRGIQPIQNTLGFEPYYFQGKNYIPQQYFQNIFFPDKKTPKYIIFLNSQDTDFHNTAYPNEKKIVFIKDPILMKKQVELSKDDVCVYKYQCSNKKCTPPKKLNQSQNLEENKIEEQNSFSSQNQNQCQISSQNQIQTPYKKYSSNQNLAQLNQNQQNNQNQQHYSGFLQDSILQQQQCQIQDQELTLGEQQFDEEYSKNLYTNLKCKICNSTAKVKKYYIFKHKLQEYEDESLDYKYYNLKNKNNLEVISKFACACLNKDKFQDEKIAGKLIFGIKDNPPVGQSKRIVCQGNDISDTDFEHFKNSLNNTIDRITTIYQQDPRYIQNKPTDQVFNKHFQLSKHEILHYDRQTKKLNELYQYCPAERKFSKKCIIELLIKRITIVVNDPIVILYQGTHRNKVFCQRVLDSSTKFIGLDTLLQNNRDKILLHLSENSTNNLNFIARQNIQYNKEIKAIQYTTVSQSVKIKELEAQNSVLQKENQDLKNQLLKNDLVQKQPSSDNSDDDYDINIFELPIEQENNEKNSKEINLNNQSKSKKKEQNQSEKKDKEKNNHIKNPEFIKSQINFYQEKLLEWQEFQKKAIKQTLTKKIINWFKEDPLSKALFLFSVISFIIFRKKIK